MANVGKQIKMANLGKQIKMANLGKQINSQSLEDTQVGFGYILQKYSLEIQKYHQRTDQKYDGPTNRRHG